MQAGKETVVHAGIAKTGTGVHSDFFSATLVFGTAGWRYAIFQRELPLVLEAFRYGDRALFAAHPELDGAPIRIHFSARQRRYRRVEQRGTLRDYRL